MFAFKLWGQFGSFRDPLTITQNITLNIPPKTTIGGMLAAVLGIDYNEYFSDPGFFDFTYSVRIMQPIRKKSFSQNYIEDYTKKSESKYNTLTNLENKGHIKDTEKLYNTLAGRMTKPKPIYRELLINPAYLIFIDNFKYEQEIVTAMKKHCSAFALFMGNSEFPANYSFIECLEVTKKNVSYVDSFTANPEMIQFESGKTYTTMHSATRVTGNREFRDYRRIVYCNEEISFKAPITAYTVKLSIGEFNCEFI